MSRHLSGFQFLPICAVSAWLTGCQPSPVAPRAESPPEPRPAFPAVTIQGDRLLVGGQKFLVVGVGYEPGCRPGQLPWSHVFEPDVMRRDFQRVREAGFNTIRCWSPLSDPELELAAEYGLWVIQGLWIKPDADFNDPKFRQETLAAQARDIRRLSRHPNILFYLLMNEPAGEAVYRAGREPMNEFFRQLAATARQSDPKRPVSYSNCIFTDYMAPRMFDLVGQNVYPYSPSTIEKALGYRAYLELIRKQLGPDKPMVITEFGLSVSPTGDGRGYGGNSLEQQRDGVVRMWDDILNTGCAGGCAFMWIDGWWKHDNPQVHDDQAEEWYGLLEADSGYAGKPRPVYYALQEYNRAIRTSPRDGDECSNLVPIEVWAPQARQVQARIDEGGWYTVPGHTLPWWRAAIDVSSLPEGPHQVWTCALDEAGKPLGDKSCFITIRRHGPACQPPVHVRLRPLPGRISAQDPLPVEVAVTDCRGQPVAGRSVRIERFAHNRWNEFGLSAVTDKKGVAGATLPALGWPGIISLAAGIEYDDAQPHRRYGDYVHAEVMP